MADQYTSAIYSARDQLSSGLQSVLSPEDANMVRDIASRAYSQGRWAYNYWEVDEQLQQLAERLALRLRDELVSEIDAVLHLDRNRITVWDPEHGRVAAQLYLPLEWPRFDALPNVNKYVAIAELLVSRAEAAAHEAAALVPHVHVPSMPATPDVNVNGWYNYYRPSLDVKTWLPPFEGSSSTLAFCFPLFCAVGRRLAKNV